MVPADIEILLEQLNAADRDADLLVRGASEEQGVWQPARGAWSIAQCLDHLATANTVYLNAMSSSAKRARERGLLRRGPALPGFLGAWFVRSLEPPVRMRLPAPKAIVPRSAPSLADAYFRFQASQRDVREFLHANRDLDLASIRFPNPFIKGIRLSLATGLQVITAHERRHLWQVGRVREAVMSRVR